MLLFLRQPFDGAQDKAQDSVQSQNGQGLVEYALILVMVAVVVIAILMLLGPIVGNVFSNLVVSI